MTDEMFTTRQAALYLGITEADVRLAVREGKLRAWTMPAQKGLVVRKSELLKFRDPRSRISLTRQLPLFTADRNGATFAREDEETGTNAA